MSISYIGAQGAASTTVTIPTHQSGDMILIFAYRDGSNTAPSVPAAGGTVPTWNLIGTSGANTNSSRFHYAVATGSTTTSGTWTNATELICLVYRGTKLVGTSAPGSGSATTTVNYPALTLQRTDNSSWVVGVAGHRTATNVELAPTGMTNRASSGTEAAGHDTAGTVSSWSNQNVTVNASSAFRSWTVELRDATVVLTAAAGSFTETGIAAGVNHGAKIVGNTGTYTHTGKDATLTKGTNPNKILTADVGIFSELGRDAGILHAALLTGQKGTYAANGVDATLRHAVVITAAKGTFTELGNDASLLHTAILSAEKATYAFVGNNADLHYVAGIDLNVDVGQFLITEGTAVLRKSYIVIAATRAFNVNGIGANLVYAGNVINDNHHYYQIQETDPRKMVLLGQPNNGQYVYYVNHYLRIL